MRPDTLSKLAVTAAICATVASGIAVGMANGRINDLEMQRDIYKSRAEDWEGTAGIVAQYADDLADELKIRSKLDEKLDVEYAGIFKCTAYCTEKWSHICGTGTGTTASGQPIQAGVTVAAVQAYRFCAPRSCGHSNGEYVGWSPNRVTPLNMGL